MIEIAVFPAAEIVAENTIGRESGLDMVWVFCPFVLTLMAVVALAGCALIDAAYVALCTEGTGMTAPELEEGMVELAVFPSAEIMAKGAVGGEAAGNVIGFTGSFEVVLMARVALRGGFLVNSAGMAFRTIDGGMLAGEIKEGMIVLAAFPSTEIMTDCTIG